MYFLEKSLAGTTARQSELTNVDTAAKWKYIRCNGEQESWQVEITLLSRRRQALRSHLLNWPIMKNLYVFIYLFCENIHLFRWICHKCAHNKLIHFTPLTCSMYNFHRKRIQVHFNRDFMGEKCCRRWDSSSQSSDLKSSGAGCLISKSAPLWRLSFFEASSMICFVNCIFFCAIMNQNQGLNMREWERENECVWVCVWVSVCERVRETR